MTTITFGSLVLAAWMAIKAMGYRNALHAIKQAKSLKEDKAIVLRSLGEAT